MITLWARAFFATCVWEGLTLQALQPRLGVDRRALLGVGIGLQVVTHPALWFVFPRFEPYWLWLLVAEGVVWSAEAALLGAWVARQGGDPKQGALAAVAANAVSTLVGLLGIY